MSTIQIDHLVKDYEDVRAVDDVTFAVAPGTVTGFLGPNGSGKTTTLTRGAGHAVASGFALAALTAAIAGVASVLIERRDLQSS